MILNRNVIEKYNISRRRIIFDAWKEHLAQAKLNKKKLIRMADLFRKYHSGNAFQKYRQEAFSFTVLSNKYKKVATIINKESPAKEAQVSNKKIEELQNQIRGLDKAFKLMFEDKASKKELEQFKASLDSNRALSIFNDMKQLFDVTMVQIKAYIDKEKEGLREGFQYVL